MRIARWAVTAALALAALSGCYIIFNFDPVPSVDLDVSSTVLLAGERVAIVAHAYDPQGNSLAFEWYEDGSLIAGETGTVLQYWKAVEQTTYATVTVVVRDGHGGYGTDSLDFTIDPRYGGVIVVTNNSLQDIWYFKDCLTGTGKWSVDRLGSEIIPSGSSFPVVQDTAYGYAYATWDLRAIPYGQDEYAPDPAEIWQVTGVHMDAYEVYPITLVD